jgi:hypothetical protein
VRTIRTARSTLRRRRTSTASLAWRVIAVLRNRKIGQFLFEIRLVIAIYWVLGRGAETAAASHCVTVGQNMREATVIPISAAARREEQARRLATATK